MIQQGLVQTSGEGRALLYYLVSAKQAPTAEAGTNVPLSLHGKEVQNYVQQPIDRRPAAGYNPDLLHNYQPNRDAYLNPFERSRLMELGQTARQKEPAGTYARHILERLLIDLSWNSSRLEGNTYSLLDTQILLSQGQQANDKSAAEAQMILNHKEAIEFLVDFAPETGFNRYTITNLHALLSNNLLRDPAASGRLRTFPVGITNSAYLPLSLPQQIEEYFELFLEKAEQIKDPFEQSFFAMVHLPYLQPFDDVNKRVSRLAANIPLNKWNLAPDQSRFEEVVESELLSLHPGNFARYRILPSQFAAWQAVWNGPNS